MALFSVLFCYIGVRKSLAVAVSVSQVLDCLLLGLLCTPLLSHKSLNTFVLILMELADSARMNVNKMVTQHINFATHPVTFILLRVVCILNLTLWIGTAYHRPGHIINFDRSRDSFTPNSLRKIQELACHNLSHLNK